MKSNELEKIRKDVECYLHDEVVLLHYSNNRVFILSNNIGLKGTICIDFSEYRDRYSCSYFIFNTSSGDWDMMFFNEYLQYYTE